MTHLQLHTEVGDDLYMAQIIVHPLGGSNEIFGGIIYATVPHMLRFPTSQTMYLRYHKTCHATVIIKDRSTVSVGG